MIAVDTNVLVYAHRQDSQFHHSAQACIKQLAEGTAMWAIPWPCLHEFYATVTHPKIYAPASTAAQTINQIEAWLASPTLTLLSESPAHWPELKALLLSAKVAGAMAHDARIAALCRQHGVKQLWTVDRDFARFKTLNAVNPLV
jgi:uncharacterized protein